MLIYLHLTSRELAFLLSNEDVTAISSVFYCLGFTRLHYPRFLLYYLTSLSSPLSPFLSILLSSTSVPLIHSCTLLFPFLFIFSSLYSFQTIPSPFSRLVFLRVPRSFFPFPPARPLNSLTSLTFPIYSLPRYPSTSTARIPAVCTLTICPSLLLSPFLLLLPRRWLSTQVGRLVKWVSGWSG